MASHLNSIPADVCLGEVPPLNRRKLVAFFNCFIQKSTSLLNELALKSEVLITEMEKHLRVMDARLTILEKKVSDINIQQDKPKVTENTRMQTVKLAPAEEEPLAFEETEPAVSPESNEVCQKYYKMLRMGVPEAAVKLKMKAENVDPNLLRTDPSKTKPKVQDELSEASESSVEFSDSE